MNHTYLTCPHCGSDDTMVTDTRGCVRRRRCKHCQGRFVTQERVCIDGEVIAPTSTEKTAPTHARLRPEKSVKKDKPDKRSESQPVHEGRSSRQRIDDLMEARSLGLSLDNDDWSKTWPNE